MATKTEQKNLFSFTGAQCGTVVRGECLPLGIDCLFAKGNYLCPEYSCAEDSRCCCCTNLANTKLINIDAVMTITSSEKSLYHPTLVYTSPLNILHTCRCHCFFIFHCRLKCNGQYYAFPYLMEVRIYERNGRHKYLQSTETVDNFKYDDSHRFCPYSVAQKC